MRQGEWCDANLRQEGYDLPSFDDSAWEDAFIANEPGGFLTTSDMPPIRVIRTLEAKKISDNTYDFGENTSGWAKITVSGEKGREIRLKYHETPDEDSQKQVRGFCRSEKHPLSHEDVFDTSKKLL